MSISQKTLQHPVLTLIVFVMLAIMGLFTLKDTAISLMPDTDNPMMMVSATYTNAGPESVEKSVTTVLESALVSLSNLKKMTSTSSEGSGFISLEFNYGTDLDVATNDVRDKLSRVTSRLPDGVSPTIMKMDSDSMPIMQIAVRGNRSRDDLKQLADDTIADILEQADGVAEASVSGGRTKIVRVELEQNRLAAYGLTLTAVSGALAKQNLELGGGTITEGKTDYSIRTTGEYQSVDEINNTVITTINGYAVKLSDIGKAFIGYADKTNEVYINGQPGVYISITKQSGKNSVSVANSVYKKIEQAKKVLPSDVTMEIISDDTESIRSTIKDLLSSAWQGLVLSVLILFVFLCSFKSTIIIAISIPLSIIITLLCMNFAGITLNMMTLTGLILGVGMIVDASIVMIDNIYSYRARGAKAKVAAILGSQEMMMSVVSGNLTTICVFIPFLFFMKELGFLGQMFKGIIFTVVIALVSSLFVAIFLVPVLAGKFLPLDNRTETPVRNKFLIWLYGIFNRCQDAVTNAYHRALESALNHRKATMAICISALLISIALIFTMKINMMPNGRDNSVTLNVTMPTGTSLEETTTVINQFQKIVESEVKGYTTLITSVGTGGRGNSASTNKGSIQIQLPSEGTKGADSADAIQNKLRKHFTEFTDAKLSFNQGWSRQMMGSDINIALRSDDLNAALKVAKQITDVMSKIKDLGESSVDTTEGLPQVQIEIDRQRAYSFGVNVQTVANEINACVNGTASTVYRNGGKDYTVYVMLQPSDRQKVIDLEQIFVQGTNGRVCVANFAKVTKGVGPVSIRRENQKRIVHVTADILSTQNSNVVENEIKQGISNTFIVPDNVSVSYEGSWQSLWSQLKVYLLIILMAILLVFGVMAGTYENFKAPLINLTTIPFFIIGVVLIYKLKNQPISLMSAIGIIMLVGIVVNNGIILVDYTSLLIDRGMPMKEACLSAGTSRLRPVLMTTLTTILGMLPMCFASSGNSSMVQPIGVAVVGGLTSSTFVTLFFIPVLYSLVMKEKKQRKSKIKVLLTDAEIAEANKSDDAQEGK